MTMASMTPAQFQTLNLMAGTVRSLQQAAIPVDQSAIWANDWGTLVNDLSKIVDPDLGADLSREQAFYTAALQVAAGYFVKPFGGLRAATGQFGFRMIHPEDLKQANSAVTPAYYSWVQTLVTDSARTRSSYAFGYSSGGVYTSNVANQRSLLAFHRLISYKPDPRLLAVEWNINNGPYIPYTVEPFTKINKAQKFFKIIPMPGNVLIQPGGSFYAHMFFDLMTGATAPTGTTKVDIEIALFGLVFAEFDYLNDTATTFV